MKKLSGFTLIELLAVIAIVGLFSTVAVASLQNVRASSRDTIRLANLERIVKGIELYYLDFGYYPDTPDGFCLLGFDQDDGTWSSVEYCSCLENSATGFKRDSCANSIIEDVPHDPLYPSDHTFVFHPTLGPLADTCLLSGSIPCVVTYAKASQDAYSIIYRLETNSDHGSNTGRYQKHQDGTVTFTPD